MSAGPPAGVTFRAREAGDLAHLAALVARAYENEFDAPAGDAYSREAEALSLVFDPGRDVLLTAESGDSSVGVLLVVPGGRERGRRLLRARAFAVSSAACRLYWLYGFRVAALEAFPVGGAVRELIVFEKRLE